MYLGNFWNAAGLGRNEPARYDCRKAGLGLVCGLLAFGFSTTPASAIDVNKFKKQQVTKAKIDPNLCNVTPKMVQDWIDEEKLTEDLDKAYKALAAGLASPNLPRTRFGHAKSRNIAATKTTVVDTIREQRTALWNMSQQIVANQIPACDNCEALNTWGKLKFIRDTDSHPKFGRTALADITLFQVEHKDVRKEIGDYFKYRALRSNPALATYPPGASANVRTGMNNDCIDEIIKNANDLDKIDATQCNRDFITDTAMNDQRDTIGTELDDALRNRTTRQISDDKNMSGMTSNVCQPLQNYLYMPFALRP